MKTFAPVTPVRRTSDRRGAQTSIATFLFALLCSFPVAGQREYTGVPIVAEGKTVKIAQHVYVIPDEKRRGVPNVGIIVGSLATLIVDPGMGLKSGEAILREVAKVAEGREYYIVNTHFHPEHTTGEVAFPAGTKVIRSAAQQRDIEEEGLKWVAEFSSRSGDLADLLKDVKAFRAPAEIFEREKVLDLGGVRVRLLLVGPGHTRGDTAVFVEGDGVLFSGDLAMQDVFPAFTSVHSRVDTWLAGLEVLAGLKPKHVVGAHYAMGDATIIAAYREYFIALRARVAELKAQGKTAEEAARTLRAEFHAKYPGWDQPLRVHGAATAVYSLLP